MGIRRCDDVDLWLISGRDVAQRDIDVARTSFVDVVTTSVKDVVSRSKLGRISLHNASVETLQFDVVVSVDCEVVIVLRLYSSLNNECLFNADFDYPYIYFNKYDIYYYTGNITSIRHRHSDCIAVFKYKSITCLKNV